MAGEISRKYRKQNRNVFVLAFHVDYWNHLHWKDPFSQHAFTDRQRQYAHALGLRSLYTPQMIVNGREEFVGSNRTKAFATVEKMLKSPAAAKISLRARTPQTTPAFQVDYVVEAAGDDTDLHFALVEGGLVRKISRGENAGKTLRHENVVRVFQTVALPKNHRGTTAIALPRDLTFKNASIIAYTQNSETLAITAAAMLPLVAEAR